MLRLLAPVVGLAVCVSLLTIVLTACGSSGPAAAPSTTPAAQGRLSEDEAIQVAMGSGGDIIQDSTPQEASAHLTTYAEALAEAGALAKTDLGTPQAGDPVEAADPVWLVRLKGMFHHPIPPGFPEPEAACFELITLVDDRTGQSFLEALPPAEGCSQD